ncbi:ATPase family associated with various cellular activities (AAA) [Pseudoruegeria aquimaris]|uniref:ATPase family associated with various cellular activities (AAA) n=1 Tax=Pseudoruegeria aquimaris TaxID=393663 RepID=A0A1Y5SCP1_9RHOB|nr:MoxR family ATPase [Pseudoruegeria aquimaris]SLN37589.1 ATPase family associated with various cellular activities (AAA) [Pseudoruegeria aquimaris]
MSAREQIEALKGRMGQSIIGQEAVIDRLLIGLLANGNLLVEGLPGLAKTRAIKALARNLEADFSRIQFTPDLLPADVTGTEVYHQGANGAEFRFEAGPIFANIVLADEINRAPAKVQSALLEAMEERQVTVAGKTHRMPPLFMVMATQNPVEQEGTYALPEAQMDRFLMHVLITYPPIEDEVEVIRLVRGEEQAAVAAANNAGDGAAQQAAPAVIPQQAVFEARQEIAALHVSDAIDQYIAALVYATRTPEAYSEDLARWIEVGGSPRASLALDKCSSAHAWMAGRDYVDPQDVQAVAPDVFRHRLALSFEAQGEGISPDDVTAEILKLVALG